MIGLQFIEFAYCHDQYPKTSLEKKHANYNPLTDMITNRGWKVKPLITITTGFKDAIHEHLLASISQATTLHFRGLASLKPFDVLSIPLAFSTSQTLKSISLHFIECFVVDNI